MMREAEAAIPLADLPEGSNSVHRLCGREVLVIRRDGAIHAVESRCPHGAGALIYGTVKDGTIECPLHGALFRLSDGHVERQPSPRPLRCHPCRIEGDRLLISLPAESDEASALPGPSAAPTS